MNDFEHEEQEIIALARQQRLKVLIWGPGDPGERDDPVAQKGYAKRRHIRGELKKNFPRSQVTFSEELEKSEVIIGTLTQEAIQAKIADLVIILDISRGADLELDYFTKYSWFRQKVWLLVPKEYVNTTGIIAEVFKLIPKDQMHGFTAEEFDRCDVAKIMSVNIVTTVAALKLLEA
jgi:hypothetical protein